MWLYNDKPVEAEPMQGRTVEIQTEIMTIEPTTEVPIEASATSSFISPLGEQFDSWLSSYCKQLNIEPYLVLAIIEQESNYDASAIGDQGGSYGLMQIQVRYHTERMQKFGYTNSDLLQPIPNVIVGIDYLQELISMGNGIEWALSAYNGGISYADRNGSTEYSRRIIARAQELAFYD